MPRTFEFPLSGLPYSQPAELWVPLALRPEETANRADNFNFGVVGRLKAGGTMAAADAEMLRTAALVQKEDYPADAQANRAALEASATPLGDLVVGEARPTLWLLAGAVAVLLLIACANVANLLLARGVSRRREMALRGALGAGRGRLVRQLLVESALVGLTGGAGGLLAAAAGVRALAAAAPPALPRAAEISVDARVLGFALVASLLCGLVFGVAPALTASGAEVIDALREGGRGASAGRRAERLRDGFVVAQVALALVLVTGAGLLVRSLLEARGTDPGFRASGALTMSLSLPAAEYPKQSDVDRFFDTFLTRTRALPGISAATESSDLPLGLNWTRLFTADGSKAAPGHALPQDAHTLVSAHYFDTLGIPLVEGRSFTPVEFAGHSNVVIVSARLARRFWPDGRAVGRRLKWGDADSQAPWLTVVGVAADVKQGALDEPTMPHTYEPYRQACTGPLLSLCTTRHLVIRSSLDESRATDEVREVLRRLDPQQPLWAVKRLSDVVDASLAPRNFNTMLVSLFAAAALVLAAVGVYGVMAYTVSQRTAEIGTRLALGASPRSIAGLVLGHAIRLALAGVALGLAGAFILTRDLATLLFEVRPTDPLSFGAGAAVLTLVAAAACYVPVRRAIRVNPVVAMGS
jgi:putative ABC transport system permease protein